VRLHEKKLDVQMRHLFNWEKKIGFSLIAPPACIVLVLAGVCTRTLNPFALVMLGM
jgi:hypothetical protein